MVPFLEIEMTKLRVDPSDYAADLESTIGVYPRSKVFGMGSVADAVSSASICVRWSSRSEAVGLSALPRISQIV